MCETCFAQQFQAINLIAHSLPHNISIINNEITKLELLFNTKLITVEDAKLILDHNSFDNFSYINLIIKK